MSASLLNLTSSEASSEAVAPLPSRPSSGASWFGGLLREPLLHFIVLGGLLFAADHVLVARSGDPRTIVVGADVENEAIETFRAARNREPTRDELEGLHRVWLDNEVLYREGLALQVDKGDAAIRERVIFKALSVIDSNVKLPPSDDKVLRQWFEAHREKYDEPPRYDFEEAALSGDTNEGAVRAFVEQLNGGVPGDAKAGLRVFKARPKVTIVQSYGPEFAKALAESPPGQWQALHTRDGWRAIRLDATIAPRPAVYEAVRGVVQQDWADATAAEQRTAAVRALTKTYKVRFETPMTGGVE